MGKTLSNERAQRAQSASGGVRANGFWAAFDATRNTTVFTGAQAARQRGRLRCPPSALFSWSLDALSRRPLFPPLARRRALLSAHSCFRSKKILNPVFSPLFL